MSEPTQEQKRVLIAEACGAKWQKTGARDQIDVLVLDDRMLAFIGPKDSVMMIDTPDYFTDLNACHSMERVVEERRYTGQYVAALRRITQTGDAVWPLLRLTAAQRAEAFGKTLGLWK